MAELLSVLAGLPLLALATYRVWRIIAVDQITEPIRDLFIWNNTQPWKWITDLVSCPWCLGWWLSGGAAWAYVAALGLSWWWVVLLWPAVSCVVGFLGKLDD